MGIIRDIEDAAAWVPAPDCITLKHSHVPLERGERASSWHTYSREISLAEDTVLPALHQYERERLHRDPAE